MAPLTFIHILGGPLDLCRGHPWPLHTIPGTPINSTSYPWVTHDLPILHPWPLPSIQRTPMTSTSYPKHIHDLPILSQGQPRPPILSQRHPWPPQSIPKDTNDLPIPPYPIPRTPRLCGAHWLSQESIRSQTMIRRLWVQTPPVHNSWKYGTQLDRDRYCQYDHSGILHWILPSQ